MAGKSGESPDRFSDFMNRLKGTGSGGSPSGGPSKRQVHFSLVYFFIALLVISWLQNRVFEQQVQKLPYSEFKQMVRDGRVDKLILEPDRIRGQIKDAKENQGFVTVRVPDEELVKLLDDKNIQYSGRLESKWLESLLSWLLPMVFLFVFWSFLDPPHGRRSAGGAFGGQGAGQDLRRKGSGGHL